MTNLLVSNLAMSEEEKNSNASDLASSLDAVMRQYEKESNKQEVRTPEERLKAVNLFLDELLEEQQDLKKPS